LGEKKLKQKDLAERNENRSGRGANRALDCLHHGKIGAMVKDVVANPNVGAEASGASDYQRPYDFGGK
jgi:hypothetical protein